MKKVLRICLFVLLVFVILAICTLKPYISELPSRFAKYHNAGNITVIMDGKKLDLDDVELIFEDDRPELIEKTSLVNGEFKFKKGIYGTNCFTLKIPNKDVGDVSIEFGQFNTNWWHVCYYDIEVQLVTNENGTISAKMRQNIDAQDNEEVYESDKIITKEDNIISIF